jgi:ribosomal protein L11 methyltransferase
MTGLGLDIEGTAIDNARENIGINRVKNNFGAREGSLQEINKKEKYHLIVANILAGPLMEMSAEIVELLFVKDYCLILSGILSTQAERVAKTYQAAGLGEPEISVQDEWSALVWFG